MTVNGVCHNQNFSVKKYGKDEAIRLAEEWKQTHYKVINEGGHLEKRVRQLKTKKKLLKIKTMA